MIKISGLNKSFGEKIIFSDYSLKISSGEFVVLSGDSGSGKTTLLNIIGGLEKFDDGEVIVAGTDLKRVRNNISFFRDKVGFLFQNYGLIENKTVKSNFDIVKKNARSEFTYEDALSMVGLNGYENRYVYSLSGGEQQRIAIARLILKKCDLILADEPTGSLDKNNSEMIFDILRCLNEKSGKTIVMSTHDELIKNKVKRIVEIGDIHEKD